MRRLILFAKIPVAGRVKTRLTPPLPENSALALYRAFLIDSFAFLSSFQQRGYQVECSTSEPWSPEEAQANLGVDVTEIAFTVQRGDDLGARMGHALDRSLNNGATATVILGADAPTVPAKLVVNAFDRLENGADTVIAPSTDGGYVLIGCKTPPRELFENIPWGGPEVAASTRTAARKAGIDLQETDPWYDIDRFEDLAVLEETVLSPGGERRAPATSAALRSLFPDGLTPI
jgi:rSAM/selenodomain-associated transferase 1